MAEETERDELLDEDFDELEPEDLPGIAKSLRLYRVMAWVVGVLLILLTLVGMPLKYIPTPGSTLQLFGNQMVMVVGISHGWLYALLLVTVVALGMRVKWRWVWYLGIALAGTVPFLSFYAEHRATKHVRHRMAEVEAAA
ncbi:MAG: DUF3817 domain-containing protein [Propionibacterium sp.]|nr:DUF3817 domain-containing protein [Propionibacterium sp.]